QGAGNRRSARPRHAQGDSTRAVATRGLRRAIALLRSAQRVEAPAVAFRRAHAQVGPERSGEAPLGRLPLALRLRLPSLLVQRRRDAGRAAPLRMASLHDPPDLIGAEPPAGAVPWPHGEVAFFVDDVDAEHGRLVAAGVRVLAPPTDRPWGERTLHIADPDGNVVELTRPRRRAQSSESSPFQKT